MLLYSILFIIFLLLFLKLLLETKSKNLPPSPIPLPFLGHLHLLKKPLQRTFFNLSQKYGQIFCLRFGSQLVVIVSSSSAVEECFTKNDIIFANRFPFTINKFIAYNCTTLGSSSYGAHWRNLRRITNQVVLRLYPVIPVIVPHMSSDYCTIGKYTIPPKTILLVNAWAIHGDPKLWDDRTCFNPERLDGNNEVNTFKLLPFGLGRRACPGIGLANRIIGLTLGSLIQCFEWERINDEPINMHEGIGGIAMSKSKPLEAWCKPRSTMDSVQSCILRFCLVKKKENKN